MHSCQMFDILNSVHNAHLIIFRHCTQLVQVTALRHYAQLTDFRNLERLAHLTVFSNRSFTQLAQLTAFKYHAQLTAWNIMNTQFVNCITTNISHHAQLTLSAVMYSWHLRIFQTSCTADVFEYYAWCCRRLQKTYYAASGSVSQRIRIRTKMSRIRSTACRDTLTFRVHYIFIFIVFIVKRDKMTQVLMTGNDN